ncbi:maleylpyruvate isomerase N-terminal domain-containing protein [Glycomyces sp. L485]|uniref:maleylpyruvate isomerase N-terminal domain-containing protein n=1 Tax=Glycomyces sp. L485 TaxID=2909235 RepID=UPI001F4B8077|nr:maleylpyruvate isomerase N-terminal domain-containing protein [Glycomyces sp. L485]MCH7231509.1 maleylpyruvate isomerase N-terminal domain-containing protein [Glycomyces sp. L485]
MTPIRKQYLTASQTAVDLLADGDVAGAWESGSALEGFTVGGLAAHLAAQIRSGAEALDTDFTGKAVIGVLDHFDRAAWLGARTDNAYNTAIRTGGEHDAASGPETVLTEAKTALKDLHDRLPALGDNAIGGAVRWPYATGFDDFLITRIMEIVVHADDLACSVGIDTPEFDADVFDTATWILTRLSARRHGQSAVIRALARSERAGDDVSAL